MRSLWLMLCVITCSVIGSVLGGCGWGLFSSGAHVFSWQGKSNTYESSTFEVPGSGLGAGDAMGSASPSRSAARSRLEEVHTDP